MIESGRDLFEMTKSNSNNDEDLVLDIRYLLENIEEGTDLYIDLEECLEEYCNGNVICSYCGKDKIPMLEDNEPECIIHRCMNNECDSY